MDFCQNKLKEEAKATKISSTDLWDLMWSRPGNPNRIISDIRFVPGAGSGGIPDSFLGTGTAGTAGTGARAIGSAAETEAKIGRPGGRLRKIGSLSEGWVGIDVSWYLIPIWISIAPASAPMVPSLANCLSVDCGGIVLIDYCNFPIRYWNNLIDVDLHFLSFSVRN